MYFNKSLRMFYVYQPLHISTKIIPKRGTPLARRVVPSSLKTFSFHFN